MVMFESGFYKLNLPCSDSFKLDSCTLDCFSTVSIDFTESSALVKQLGIPRSAQCTCGIYSYPFNSNLLAYSFSRPNFYNQVLLRNNQLTFIVNFLDPKVVCSGTLEPVFSNSTSTLSATTSLPSSIATSSVSSSPSPLVSSTSSFIPSGSNESNMSLTKTDNSTNVPLIAGIVSTILILFAFLIAFYFYLRYRNLTRLKSNEIKPPEYTNLKSQILSQNHLTRLSTISTSPSISITSGHIQTNQYRAIYHHIPNLDDEIEVLPNDLIFITEVYEDDWATGFNSRSGKTGKVPMTALEVVCFGIVAA